MATFTDQDIKDYISQAGLTGNYAAIAQEAARAGVSAEQMGRVLGFNASDVYAFGTNAGVNLPASNATKEAVVTDVYINQLGRAPTNAEIENGVKMLTGGMSQEKGSQMAQRSLEGYNYDVQDITSAFRQVYGRNPTQEEFVTTAEGLGLGRVNRNVLQFDNYQDALVNEFLQNELRANPNNPDAAYQNTIRQALRDGVTVDQLSRSTGFGADVIQNYASANQLGNLQTYDALRAANPFRTSATMAAFESDPYGGRFATVNPYTQEGINLSQTRAGDFIQYTSPITQQPLTIRFENGKLTVQAGQDIVQDQNAAQTIARSFATGTLTQPEYDQMVRDLQSAKSMTEVYDAFSKPQAQVVMDPKYGFQVGQGKTLAEAMTNAQPIQNLLNQVNLGVMPGVSVIQELAKAQGVPYVYTPEMFGMQANERGGFDFGAAPAFSTLQTPEQVVTRENQAKQLQNLVDQITGRFGQAMDVRTPLSGGFYSERGFEPTYMPIGVDMAVMRTEGSQGGPITPSPMFRSGVAGYIPESALPQGFQFGTNQVVVPTPVFEPGPFTPPSTGTTPPVGFTSNPIIGYAANGAPIYAPAAVSDASSGAG